MDCQTDDKLCKNFKFVLEDAVTKGQNSGSAFLSNLKDVSASQNYSVVYPDPVGSGSGSDLFGKKICLIFAILSLNGASSS